MSPATLAAIGMPRTMTTWMKLVLLVLSAVAGWWGLSSFDYERYLSPTTLAQWLNDAGPWAPLLLIGSMICAVVIPPIPSLPLVLAAGAAFGPFDGAIYAVIGAEIGATVCFLVARAWGRQALSRVMKTEATFGQMYTEHQLMGVVFFARLIPSFSFEVSYGAGLTKISLKNFALATLFGMAPPTLAFTYLGSSVVSAQWPLIAAGAAMVLFFLAMPKILTTYQASTFARQFLGPLPAPAAVPPAKSGIPLPINCVGCGAAVGKSKIFFKVTPMFRSLLVALLLIVGRGTGWAADEHGASHWSYEGQEGAAHWDMLSPAYMACEAGSHQSPIDIAMPRHTQQERLILHYQSGLVRALDNGHTIQVNVPPGNELHLNGRTYRLGQFHFHEPSEHHVDGRTYPLEVHLVYQDPKGHVVVIGVLVEAGSPNQSLAELWTMLPMKAGELGSEHPFNPQDLIPPNTHHFSYHGSLTTPPCTEGVQWIVLRDPISMSVQQIAQFVSIIGHNARPVQPLHGRRIQEE